jgi:hypothetical protein
VVNILFGVVFSILMVTSQLYYLTSSERFSCEVCGSSFSKLDKLKRHTEQAHLASDLQASCLLCHATFESQSELMFHMSSAHSRPLTSVRARFQN